MTNIVADTPVETVKPNAEAPIIDWEARALKAENKIVDLKKSAKEKPVEEPVVKTEEEVSVKTEDTPTPTAATTKTVAEMEADLEARKEADITANANAANLMGLSWGKAPIKENVYKMSDLSTMSQAEYNKAKDRIDSWEASVDRTS